MRSCSPNGCTRATARMAGYPSSGMCDGSLSRTPADARSVAWLHEVLEFTAVSEEKLLQEGLTSDELRALRLLNRTADTRSDRVYLAHLELIARAAGRSGDLARMVKIADLEDRCLHPRVRPDGWSPPYELGLQLLRPTTDDRPCADATDAAEKRPPRTGGGRIARSWCG